MTDQKLSQNTHEVMTASADESFREQVLKLLSSHPNVAARMTDKDYEVILGLIEGDVAVVILDMDLHPLLDGLGILDVLKKLRPSLPIIVVSADASLSTGRRVVEKGVFYYLIKPVDSNELSGIVENAIIHLDRSRKLRD